jgi:hypothetical protein
MAGVKGRSGGPRQNSGGARPGAGRKPSAPLLLDVSEPDATGPIDLQRCQAIIRMNMLDAQSEAAKRGSVAAMISLTSAWQREQKRNQK